MHKVKSFTCCLESTKDNTNKTRSQLLNFKTIITIISTHSIHSQIEKCSIVSMNLYTTLLHKEQKLSQMGFKRIRVLEHFELIIL